MKKLFLSLVLLASTHIFIHSADKNTSNPISAEHAKLYELYKVAITGYLFPQSNNFDFDYHIDKLEKEIEILQRKLHTNESGWSSVEIKFALFWMALSTIICSLPVWSETQDIFNKLSTGKFGTINIDYDEIAAKLPSLKYTRAQRKKLDRIEVTPRIIVYTYFYNPFYNSNDHPAHQWSEAEEKKVLYFARNKALNDAYFKIAFPIVTSFIMGVIPALVIIIDEIIHHQKYLAEKLTQAKFHCEHLQDKKRQYLEQELRAEAYLVQEAYRIEARAKTLSTVEI
jgi:hypothetical protein